MQVEPCLPKEWAVCGESTSDHQENEGIYRWERQEDTENDNCEGVRTLSPTHLENEAEM